MRRAVVIFVENKRHLLLQFGCLYTSFKYIQSCDTDLVVFGTKSVLDLIPDDCIKVESEPVSYSSQWNNYHFINSLYCLIGDNSNFLEEYDLLLRTDVDTFLTPAWNTFYPDYYTCGRGCYVNDEETRKNIIRISNIFGINHRGLYNIGSSHYGNSRLVREVCQLAVSISRHILNVEFADMEGSWPGWCRGVTSMYSSEIAVNHLVDKVTFDYNKLDFDSTSSDSITVHPHIHCWHTDNMFSKFCFEGGKYNHLSIADLNIDRVKDYCLFIALKSKKELPLLS